MTRTAGGVSCHPSRRSWRARSVTDTAPTSAGCERAHPDHLLRAVVIAAMMKPPFLQQHAVVEDVGDELRRPRWRELRLDGDLGMEGPHHRGADVVVVR